MKPSALLILTAIVVALGAPAFARSHHATAKSHAAAKSYASEPMSRDEAIQACNSEAEKWSYRDYQIASLTVYRNCMTRHGQQFE